MEVRVEGDEVCSEAGNSNPGMFWVFLFRNATSTVSGQLASREVAN